jgi:predicted Zn finger-like uncharacterized protein
MIVTCPACETRYQVDDAALRGADGRRVRCADCGNVWTYTPEGEAIQEAMAELVAGAARPAAQAPGEARAAGSLPGVAASLAEPPRSDLRLDAQARPAGPAASAQPPTQVELPAAAQRRKARIRGLVLTILAFGVLLILLGARGPIMRTWPQTVPVYAALRLADSPASGLEVTVTPARTADSLIINGDIVNKASGERRVPRMRVVLQDNNKNEVDSKVIDPPVATLPSGGSARFNTVFERPDAAATGVAVTFVTQ